MKLYDDDPISLSIQHSVCCRGERILCIVAPCLLFVRRKSDNSVHLVPKAEIYFILFQSSSDFLPYLVAGEHRLNPHLTSIKSI